MRNNSVVSFYDNFGLIFKGSEDKATNDIENCSLSTIDHNWLLLTREP